MLKIDELNNLEYDEEEVVQKLEKYFDAMDDITPQELDDRVSLGKNIFDLMMLFMFMVAGTNATGGYQDIQYYINMIETSYTMYVDKFGVDSYLRDYINRFSTEVVNTTFDNIDDAYYTSADRALFIAENEPNTVLNYDRYRNALQSGKTHKKWLTERDNRVRKTHKAIESVTIPIKELFHVGDSLMRFPHDVLYSEPKEYIHCRCNVEYLSKNINDSIDASNDFQEESLRSSGDGDFKVKWDGIKDQNFKETFSRITDNEDAKNKLAQRCRNALANRDNTQTEELYAIDLNTGKDIASITNQHYISGVKRTERFTKSINRAKENGAKIAFIHNHPLSSPPSIADLNELMKDEGAIGIVIGHKGNVYYYTAPNKKLDYIEDYLPIAKKASGDTLLEKSEKIMYDMSNKYNFDYWRLK